MAVPFHPLNYADWKEYLSSEEVKQSEQQRSSAYNQFFAIFPYSTSIWLQYGEYFESPSDKLFLWKRATASHKYCPVLWVNYITSGLRCMQQGTAVNIKAIFLQAIECVGSHPLSVDLWRLVLDTDLVDDDLLVFMFSCPIRSLNILWRKLEGSKHPAAVPGSIIHALMVKSEGRWAEKERFESRLVTVYEGQEPRTADITAWHDYIDREVADVDFKDVSLYQRALAEVVLLFERFLTAFPVVPDVWRRYSLWLFGVNEKARCLEVAYRGVSSVLQLTPSAHLLYSTLLQACGAVSQAKEVLNNLLLEHSCGHGHLESHIARVHFERKNGDVMECLRLYDASIDRFRLNDGRSRAEIDMTVYFLICEKAEFLCDVHPGNPQKAMEYLYYVIQADPNAFSKDEFLLVIEKAYDILCKYPSSGERDQEVTELLCSALSGTNLIFHRKITQEKNSKEEDGEIVEDKNTKITAASKQWADPISSFDGSAVPIAAAPTIIALAENFVTTKCASMEHTIRLMNVMGACRREVIRAKILCSDRSPAI